VGLYRDQGIVLRTIKLGEADRIVTILTQGHGKVRAVAKGVRKTKSRFGGRLEPMGHVSLILYAGRGDLDTITQAEAIEHFRPIREDLDRLGRCTNMLEATDQVAQERQPNSRLYQMLVGALRAVATTNGHLLVAAFFWKLLSLEGFHPVLDRCVGCEAPTGLCAFDLDSGGALCAICSEDGSVAAASAVSADALGLVRLILEGRMAEVLNRPPSSATAEVDRLATRALEHHLERRLRSLRVLDRA